jgi:hypothetical protein
MRRRDALRAVSGVVAAGLGLPRVTSGATDEPSLAADLVAYRECLDRLRRRHPGSRALPRSSFFLLGAGPRRPMLVYQAGVLREDGGPVVRRWEVAGEAIVPSAYTVELRLRGGGAVRILEDEEGLWVEEGRSRTALARSRVSLPTFDGHPWGPVLRVLHHEILVNITEAGPLPNRFVYRTPWYRDGAMVAMVLKATGNLDLLRGWILGLREPFDRNNAGETEADNPGQLLFLASFVADQTHPAVPKALEALRRYERRVESGPYVEGRSDFAPHPVYQTKWAKWGLRALGLPDPYVVPRGFDSYSALFWWDFREAHVAGPRFDVEAAQHYPYLTWAEDHFHGTTNGLVGDRDYPLTWESRASQADYQAIRPLAPAHADAQLAAPHTWHAAEMFLLLAGTPPPVAT